MADTLSDISPVLIVGAGPTGLAAAMSLARARVPVRIIDRLAAPAPYSRAIGIQARTLELLEQHRAVEPFLALGHRAHAAALHADGRVIARLDFDPLQTRYPYLLFLDQSITERLLAEHLAGLGVTVERGATLSACDTGGTSLDVSIRGADGRDESFAPSYLIAADGAHSTVRHLLGLGFAGHAFEQTFLLADFAAIPDWPDEEIHLFTTPEGMAGLFPMGGGRFRLVADRPPRSDASPDASTPSLAECEAIVRARVGASISPSDLAVGYFPDLDGNNFFQQRLFTHRFVCLMRRGHPFEQAPPFTVEQFLACGHAVVRAEGRSQEVLEKYLAKQRMQRRAVLETPHFMSLPFILSRTDLIATVPHAIGYAYAAEHAFIVPVEPPLALPRFDLKQHWHRKYHNDPRTAWLRGVVASLFNDEQDEWPK